jgi:MarR family transcriptional regulator, organic hydroperoxide resistance regulator
MTHPHCTPGMPDMPHDRADGADPLSSAVFAQFRRVMHVNRQLMMRMMSEQGGHPAQSGCLQVIAHNEGISQRELADMMHLSAPTVTAMVQKLERNGLIERTDDPCDQRVTRLKLTDAGRALNDDLRVARHRHMAATIGALSEADQHEFSRILALLGDNAEAALKHLEEEEAPKR